ncbi:uncharacterized protein N7498_007874 [Penicillium cinerascens]|uniref:F-box domain-containing protein n=1 Tax=Penicillium cinerascens TaxID=70096 RepID=A0A9W9MFN1_9EURO|nr:uncharacterized protein N7498_007874 [Penicillium cinerascens]KAJ5198757.1 hypothetical protein N7498_007874 [Penicillium cinerascens]
MVNPTWRKSDKMSLVSIPTEIIMLITSNLESSKDIFSLLRASCKLYSLLISELYERNVKSEGGSALVWYARNGYRLGVRNMLTAGANPNLRDSSRAQSTPLLEAIRYNHVEIVQILLKNRALPNAANLYSERPLTLATRGRSDTFITELLIDHGAAVNSVAFDKRAPLVEAIRSNQTAKVAVLLRHGADIHILNGREAMSPLHIAAAKNVAPAILKMLLNAGLYVDSLDRQGRTPLQVAVAHSSIRAVRKLLEYGANASFKNMSEYWRGWTALFFALKPKSTKNDNRTIIRTLIMHGAPVDSSNYAHETPLLYAVSRGATKQAQILLEYGASITVKNYFGESVLHLAAWSFSCHSNMISLLVESGADVNCSSGRDGESPLFYAMRGSPCSKAAEKVQLLLSLGTNVDFQNIDRLTPLSLAAQMCSVELANILLKHGARVNSRDKQGKSPLHHIAEANFGSASMVQKFAALLIQHGADVNSRDNFGYTPLHRAVAREWIWETAGDLLNAGADRCAMSDDGKYPYDMVPAGPWAETQRLFLRHYPV